MNTQQTFEVLSMGIIIPMSEGIDLSDPGLMEAIKKGAEDHAKRDIAKAHPGMTLVYFDIASMEDRHHQSMDMFMEGEPPRRFMDVLVKYAVAPDPSTTP